MKSKITHLTRYAAAALCCVSVFACNDLKELEDRVDSLESRVTALETQIPALNKNLEAISELMDGAKFITGITAVDGSENEYTITMSDGESYTIVQGQVGNTPQIAVDEEGYWVVDYERDGTFVRITEGGAEDGLTIAAVPQFKVSAEGNWQISTDGGKNWVDVLDTGGQKVPALAEGSDFFKDIAYDEETGELTFTLSDGQTYTFTVSSDFVCQILDSEGNQLTGTVTFTAGISKEFNVRMRGVSDVYIQKPDGWKATLEDIDASGTEDVTAVLTVTPPASVADAGTLQTKVSADSDSDLVLHATAAASDRSIFAKMTVEVGAATNVPQAAITAGEVTESNVSFTVTPNSNVTSWKYMLLPASEEAPADAAAFDTRATTVEGSEEKVLILDKDADGTALVAGTEYTLYVLAINTVGEVDVTSISSASATPMYDNLFTAYDNGNNIVIGNRTYNKTEYGEAVHITSSNSSINASYNGSEGSARIYFVDPDANATYDFTGSVADMVIIGTIPGTRSKLTVSQQIKLNKGSSLGTDYPGQFVVYNIDFDATATVDKSSTTPTAPVYPLAQNYNGNFEYVMFNNCYIKCNPTSNLPLSYISNKSRGFANFNMIGCQFEAGSTSQNYVINTGSSTMNYGNLTFENNVFFIKNGTGERFVAFNGSATTVESAVFNNNTVVNLLPCNSSNALALLYVNIVKSIEIKDNLIYNSTAITNHCGLARIQAFDTTPPTTASIQRNLVSYPASGDFTWMSVIGNKTMTGIEAVTSTTEIPFAGETFEPETGTFIPNSTYSSYGARQ